MRKKNPKSIAQIAEKCGVSVMTVSRALRNHPSVKESTRKKILEAAETIGYHRAVRAGRPVRADANTRKAVEVVLGTHGQNSTVFYSELLNAIEQKLSRLGHDCIIRTCSGEYQQFLNLKESLRRSTAIGTMITGYFDFSQLQGLLSIVPEAILVDHPGDPEINAPFDSVGFDNVEATRLAMRHLLEIGRKKILLIHGYTGHYFTTETIRGYEEALNQKQIKIDRDLMLEANFTAAEAYKVTANAIKNDIEFDAVFTNDEMACGVYQALEQHKLAIPAEIAVCGCDGLLMGKTLNPQLTTVILDYKELGELAVEYILERPRNRRSPYRTQLIPRLEIRGSTQ